MKFTRVCVTPQDMVSEPSGLNSQQTVLRLLQKKGAPVEGTIYLVIKPEITDVHRHIDLHGNTIFDFIKKEELK